ncbi:MAG: hypothetical protein N3E37_03565 [Candidatus Micrarchaeota archaeon]|nr:hypothetical protein [Candidatus Micrarchaeota archaeon]
MSISDGLKKSQAFYDDKLCDYYDKKIIAISNTICSLETSSAIKITLSRDYLLNCNFTSFIYNSQSNCEITFSQKLKDTYSNKRFLTFWVVKKDSSIIEIIPTD